MTTPLKAARIKKGWSMTKAARECRVDKGQFYRLETTAGVGGCSPEVADRIAKVFGNLVTRDQILFSADYPMPDEVEEPEAKAS